MSKSEGKFKTDLIKDIKKRFPGFIILKNDPTYIQGIPDLLILHNNKWAALETKKSQKASFRPNQEYYIEKMNKMSYASSISPENKEEVLDELSRSFTS